MPTLSPAQPPGDETEDRAVIFDMDGVLIDSEPLWREAEIEVFGEAGLALTEADCRQTTGMRMDEVVEYWAQRQPLTGRSHPEIAAAVTHRVGELIRQRGQPMIGVQGAVEICRRRGYRLGLASSSPHDLIATVLDHFALQSAFEVVRSAETETFGKPHPAVYLSTAKALGVSPRRCIAIEDSVNGVVSALAASMFAVAVPADESRDDPRFAAAGFQLATLEALGDAVDAFEQRGDAD